MAHLPLKKKKSIFNIVLIFQIYLKGHSGVLCGCVSLAIHVVDFVLNSPELLSPQQKESLLS